MNNWLNEFEYDLSLAPKKVPMDLILTDTKNFQNRKKPYNEYSVQNIINAILKWEFVYSLFNPVILRKNPKNNSLYILSGHSRHEAFKRLKKDYADNEKVQAFFEQTGHHESIPAIIVEDTNFDDAKIIALISNTLWSIETDTERAEVYRSFRKMGKTKIFIDEFWKKCEKGNRSKIFAYSYLNPNGMMIESLERFEENSDDNSILKRIWLRIGKTRREYPELSDLHENELFDWLVIKWWYGTQKEQIHTYEIFLDRLDTHLKEIKAKGQFDPEKKLNILNIHGLSPTLQNYYTILEDIITRKKSAYKEFHRLHRTLNKIIVQKWLDTDVEGLKQRINGLLNNNLKYADSLEKTEEVLFDTRPYIQEENIEKVRKEFLEFIYKIDQEYYSRKEKKWDFEEAAQNELAIKFWA